MSLIIPPGYLQAVYQFSLVGDTEPMVVTCGHEIDGASGANGPDAPDDLFGAMATYILPAMSNQYQLFAVDVYVGQDAPDSLVYTSTEAAVAGGTSGSVVPQNTAYLVRKRTDLAGRRGRGRMYFPGVSESETSNTGALSPALLSQWNGQLGLWYDHLTALVGGRLYPPVVLHRSEGAGVEPLPTPITQFTLDPTVATQRRRLRP